MSEAAVELINAYSRLPHHERHAVLIELARMSKDEVGPLTDDDLTFAGEQLFAMYDVEEKDRGETSAR